MARPQEPDSRLGRLRALPHGQSIEESVDVPNLDGLSAAKKKLHHTWGSACTRVAGQFTRAASARLSGNRITATLTITRTA